MNKIEYLNTNILKDLDDTYKNLEGTNASSANTILEITEDITRN